MGRTATVAYKINRCAVGGKHGRGFGAWGRGQAYGIATGADGKVVLQARVRAVPEDGAANAALVALLAKTLKIRKADIDLVSGATARQKSLRLAGDPKEILKRLAALCADSP